MATRLLTPCAKPGCPLATHDRFCAPHASEERRRYEAQRPSAMQRGYGQEWRRLRRLTLMRDPICRDESGCMMLSTDADHIIPRSCGGTDHPDNLRGMCHRHHSSKTAREDGRWGREGA